MTTKKRTELGKYIAKLRLRYNQSSGDMCDVLEITRPTLSSIEYGHRDISRALKNRIIDKYHLNDYEKEDLEKVIFYSNNNVKLDMSKLTKGEKEKLYKIVRGRLHE